MDWTGALRALVVLDGQIGVSCTILTWGGNFERPAANAGAAKAGRRSEKKRNRSCDGTSNREAADLVSNNCPGTATTRSSCEKSRAILAGGTKNFRRFDAKFDEAAVVDVSR